MAGGKAEFIGCSSMNRKIRFVGLTLGDPFSKSSRSGVNYNVFSRLKEKCELIDVLDLDLRGAQKFWLACSSFSPNRRRWGNKLHQSPSAFCARTRMAQSKLCEIDVCYDLIYQDGAMFMPGIAANKPFVSYHDNNVFLSARGGDLAHGAHYRGKALRKTIAQERMVYERASLIFVMSDWLKKSLIEDFGIVEEKIVTTYAGTNLPAEDFDKTYDGKTILFVGTEFERKGGPVLLEAFKRVRQEVTGARLILVGPHLNLRQDGVEVKGKVADPIELSSYFREASLFVLPSFFEPFGIVFAEAFAFKNPCIGSDLCAMPEIIEDGKGGFLVPPNDPKTLADRMITILRNGTLAKRMGQCGFEKVRSTLNWDVVVGKMIQHSEKIL
jgi:glycosyltransferase involved in cell wall biosynthesis